MEGTSIVDIYNPLNAKNITPEQKTQLANLSDDELKQLAAAYPNKAKNNNYLILKDTQKPDNKQIFQRSTFQNLYNLRAMHKKKNFIAIDFTETFKYPQVKGQMMVTQNIKSQAPQDLTRAEKPTLEGIKKSTGAKGVKTVRPKPQTGAAQKVTGKTKNVAAGAAQDGNDQFDELQVPESQ